MSRQRNFEKAGAHVKLLAETFKALEVHGTPLEVCVHDHFRPSKEPINMERIVTRHHLECYDMEDRHEGATVIKLVLKASARSGCKINRLTADIISFPHLTPTRVAMPGSAESGEFEVFEELEEITINAIAPPGSDNREEFVRSSGAHSGNSQAFEKTGTVAKLQIF